jgi:hypothetical protein
MIPAPQQEQVFDEEGTSIEDEGDIVDDGELLDEGEIPPEDFEEPVR